MHKAQTYLFAGLSLLAMTAAASATDTVRISGWGGSEVRSSAASSPMCSPRI